MVERCAQRFAEKAFDRLKWSYLFDKQPKKFLEKFDLGDNFVSWVRVLYNTPTAAVLANGMRFINFPPSPWEQTGRPAYPVALRCCY